MTIPFSPLKINILVSRAIFIFKLKFLLKYNKPVIIYFTVYTRTFQRMFVFYFILFRWNKQYFCGVNGARVMMVTRMIVVVVKDDRSCGEGVGGDCHVVRDVTRARRARSIFFIPLVVSRAHGAILPLCTARKTLASQFIFFKFCSKVLTRNIPLISSEINWHSVLI